VSEKDMQELLDIVERALGKSWLDIVEWLRDQNALDDIDARLAAGDHAGVVQAVSDAADRYAADIHAGYVSAGQTTAKWLDGEADALIRFDQTNPRATKWAEQNKLELVRGFTQEQRETVSQVITTGVRDGRNPREVARDIRTSIGLTPSQADAVASYRTALEAGDYSNALGRELGADRYDRTLLAAQRDGKTIPSDRIDTMVEAYRKNYISYRATVIARTEGLRAVHAGNEELMKQAIERGDVDADQLTRTWNHASHGKDSRPGHIAMAGKPQPFGEPFTNPITGATLMYPGDPDADPSETVQCRCAVSTRFAA